MSVPEFEPTTSVSLISYVLVVIINSQSFNFNLYLLKSVQRILVYFNLLTVTKSVRNFHLTTGPCWRQIVSRSRKNTLKRRKQVYDSSRPGFVGKLPLYVKILRENSTGGWDLFRISGKFAVYIYLCTPFWYGFVRVVV